MQSKSIDQYTAQTMPTVLGATSGLVDGTSFVEDASSMPEPSQFHGSFSSCMEMYTDAQTVAAYLDNHGDWFPRCAQPMKAEPIGCTGYALTIGRYGSFGYEVEPKIGLDLLPQDQGVYRIQTIPIPGYQAPGYEVDFQASLQLVETAAPSADLPPVMTHVEWTLELTVAVYFPRFIYALPKSLIQTTGDRLLNQIVRQVSRRLTHKVQDDFHRSIGVPFPRKRRHLRG